MGTFPSIGETAPDFVLPGDGGSTVRLAAHLGQKVVLYFYPRDDTKGCTRQAQEFSQALPAFAAADTCVIGVSADTPQSHDKFKAKHGLSVTLASDTRHETLVQFGVWKEKSMYGRKYMGIERTTMLLDRGGKIAMIWPKVKVAGHVANVLKAAEELP